MMNKIIELLEKIFHGNKILAWVFGFVMIIVIAFAVSAPTIMSVAKTISEGQQEIEKRVAESQREIEGRVAELESNMSFAAVFDIRNIPPKEIALFRQKVESQTGAMYVPMFGYCFPYGANKRFPLKINDDDEYNWVYDVENRPLITFANHRFSYNIVGEIFEEPEPGWAKLGEKYNYVVPGMVGMIVTSHWAVVLNYVPMGADKLYLEQQINSLKNEWDCLLLKYNPGVKNLNNVFD